jgi:hypothetical protein
MSFIRKHSKLLVVAGSCAALGAGASAIASAGAATSNSGSTAKTGRNHTGQVRAGRRLAARAVQGNLIVATKTGFVPVTFERGTVRSVSGQQLTLAEGTKKATYKTVTLTIPTNARVRDNRQKSTLAAVTDGQRATVVQTPKATFVIARTPR